jgi:glycosyltransferase involved in cell wall biosynthesis
LNLISVRWKICIPIRQMNNPLVSVIIPAYNSEKFIEETILSVLQQTHKELEVIIIDDGSTDNQKDIILRYCRTDSRLHYYYQSNRGVSAARNYGFRISTGSYIAFLDSDDIWLPQNIFLKLQKFSEGSYGIVHSDGQLIDEKSKPLEGKLEGNEGWLLDEILAWNATQIPGPSSVLFKREVMEKVGLFDPALSTSADQDFFIRVSAVFEVGRVKQPTWKYRIHDLNMHKNIRRMEQNVRYVYKKASENNLFKSKLFEKQCYSNMYLILASSWAGDGKNFVRSIRFIILAFIKYPPSVTNYLTRHLRK